ncbi:GDP-D-glucose phosphorylase [Phytophthora boehmeriae]|uniref:GDP-D-glucose phosphorylase n=1 Tax=Phytophthora boehmeriae TaxID=109152 RepID=A0A8T1X6F1_9STRA|nr:GDP-D-glucose phosphorylase [Phytophthora boehmeriae]
MSAPILSIEHEDVELASPLSDFLLRRWDYVESEGALRTNVKETLRRVLPGDFGLVVQFNPSHLKSKRPVDKQLLKGTAEASSAQTASPAFNFTKAKKCEFLSGLNFVDGGETCLPTVEIVEMKMEVETQHFVLVNVVPLVRGHFLFVPDINEVKPQIMEKAYLKYGLSISRAIQREDFALVAELSGLIIAGDTVAYEKLTEEIFTRILQNEVSLSDDEAAAIMSEWKANLGL